MSRRSSYARARRTALPAVTALLAVLTPVYGGSATAQPQGQTSAQAEAHERSVLAQVSSLQKQVDAAETRYDEALQAVATGVQLEVSSGQDAQSSAAAATAAQALLEQQVEALYESGGSLGVDAGVLVDGDVSSVVQRFSVAQTVISHSTQLAASAAQQAQTLSAATTTAERRVVTHIATERDVAAAAAKVHGLLAQEQTLLSSVRSQVASLKAAEAAAAAAAAAAAQSFGAITSQRIAQLQVLAPSAQFLGLYHAAARTCPGLSWTVLAGIGQVESGHGRNDSMSSAGAIGPMQFEPATFAHYAVDGDHDGVANIEDPADSVFTAARYLCANGAGAGNLAGAVWHYNHADWYVAMVMKLATLYASSYGA